MTKQTLLRHFGSKDGLNEASFQRAMGEVGAQRSEAPVGDVAGTVDNLLDHYEAVGDRALKLEAMRGGREEAGFVQAGREFRYDWVDRVFAPWLGRVAGRESKRLRAALIALCDVHTWRLLTQHLGLPRAEVRATLIQAISRLTQEETRRFSPTPRRPVRMFPLVPVLDELAARGHSIALRTLGSQVPLMTERGFDAAPIDRPSKRSSTTTIAAGRRTRGSSAG